MINSVPEPHLEPYEVSTAVNSPRNNGPRLARTGPLTDVLGLRARREVRIPASSPRASICSICGHPRARFDPLIWTRVFHSGAKASNMIRAAGASTSRSTASTVSASQRNSPVDGIGFTEHRRQTRGHIAQSDQIRRTVEVVTRFNDPAEPPVATPKGAAADLGGASAALTTVARPPRSLSPAMHAAIEDFGPTTLVEGSVTPVSIGASVDIASRFRATVAGVGRTRPVGFDSWQHSVTHVLIVAFSR